MSDHKWSSKTLQEMAEDVSYEMSQLALSTVLIESRRYPTQGGTDEQRAIGNALLESALVHARSLDEFLGKEKRGQDDDVIARDYLPEWEPKHALKPAERESVNKRLAHITTERRKGRHRWATQRLRDVFNEAIAFLQAVEREQPLKADWFRRWFDWRSAPSPPRL